MTHLSDESFTEKHRKLAFINVITLYAYFILLRNFKNNS